jgi:hypothetical protein
LATGAATLAGNAGPKIFPTTNNQSQSKRRWKTVISPRLFDAVVAALVDVAASFVDVDDDIDVDIDVDCCWRDRTLATIAVPTPSPFNIFG